MEIKAHTELTPYHLLQRFECGIRECVKGDPKDTVPVPYHEPCGNAIHASLRVQETETLTSEQFSVNLVDGSKGIKVPVKVRSSDTVGKVLLKALMLRKDLEINLNLIYNGKPVQLNKTLSELQVKPEATFLTFQKCHGG